MQKLTRFIGGCLFGGALLAAGVAVTPASVAAQTEIVLVCSGDNCCTVNSQTGDIIDCKKVRP
jgi:hypothetical protein